MEETRFNIHTFMVRCNIFFMKHNVNVAASQAA